MEVRAVENEEDVLTVKLKFFYNISRSFLGIERYTRQSTEHGGLS